MNKDTKNNAHKFGHTMPPSLLATYFPSIRDARFMPSVLVKKMTCDRVTDNMNKVVKEIDCQNNDVSRI